MKKWVILILVVLGGLLLALQYVSRRRETTAVSPPPPVQSEESGTSLPASSTNYVSPDTTPGPEAGWDVNYQSTLILPAVKTDYKGACQGGSLEEMRRTHGRFWGIGAKDVAFNFEETMRMYELLGSYVGCVAVARQNLAQCDTLPDDIASDSKKVDAAFTPRYRCREQASNALFYAYMAGKVSDPSFCQSAVSYWRSENTSKISVPDFCKAAGGGMKDAVAFLAKYMPPNVKNQGMPTSASSCGGDAACLAIYENYNAVRKDNADACQHPSNGYCEAAITRVPAPCETIVREMSQTYCSYVAKVKKGSGGYIGLSKEEVKTYSTQQAVRIAAEAEERRKKAEEESRLRNEEADQKKQNEKIQEEVNKQAKKILRKE